MDERFEAATTTPGIPPSPSLKSLYDDPSGLTISLTSPDPENTTYQVRFPTRLAFRVTDEGDRLRSMDYLNGRAATPLGRLNNHRLKPVGWQYGLKVRIRVKDPSLRLSPEVIISVRWRT